MNRKDFIWLLEYIEREKESWRIRTVFTEEDNQLHNARYRGACSALHVLQIDLAKLSQAMGYKVPNKIMNTYNPDY